MQTRYYTLPEFRNRFSGFFAAQGNFFEQRLWGNLWDRPTKSSFQYQKSQPELCLSGVLTVELRAEFPSVSRGGSSAICDRSSSHTL
jgi:hypothetical protein